MPLDVVFLEPCFPANQREFVRALHVVGARVTGIGERPKESLDPELRRWLTHYEQIGNVTNQTPGYTGIALSTCMNGTRTTVGVCLPVGACATTSPRDGSSIILLTGVGMNFGANICQRYACCNGTVSITPLSPCLLPVDLPGITISCP